MKLLVFMCVDKTLTTERTTVDILCMYVIYVLCVDIVIVCRLWMVLCYVSKTVKVVIQYDEIGSAVYIAHYYNISTRTKTQRVQNNEYLPIL